MEAVTAKPQPVTKLSYMAGWGRMEGRVGSPTMENLFAILVTIKKARPGSHLHP